MQGNMQWWRRGTKDGMPICLGYLAVSFTFGIVAKNAGLSPLQATVMSAANLTSAGQFAALDLIVSAAPYLEMALTQLVINLRYSLMSCALSQKLDIKTSLGHRLVIAFGISDEIFGVSAAVQGKLNPFYTYGLMSVAIPGWVLGTFLGVALGSVMPARLLSALSIALYGMFIAIIVPPAKKSRVIAGLIVIAMLASAAFALLPVLKEISSGFRIVILTVALSAVAAFFFPVKEDGNEI